MELDKDVLCLLRSNRIQEDEISEGNYLLDTYPTEDEQNDNMYVPKRFRLDRSII